MAFLNSFGYKRRKQFSKVSINKICFDKQDMINKIYSF